MSFNVYGKIGFAWLIAAVFCFGLQARELTDEDRHYGFDLCHNVGNLPYCEDVHKMCFQVDRLEQGGLNYTECLEISEGLLRRLNLRLLDPDFRKPVDVRTGPSGLIETAYYFCHGIFSGEDSLVDACYQSLFQNYYYSVPWLNQDQKAHIENLFKGVCSNPNQGPGCLWSLRNLDTAIGVGPLR